ncbi:hypothetical protein DPMN_039091 [Dreissena polymorpha]|uniref:Uncharacterized protein n=1 Tax=Dreissena polymorpha TaxID=45954 RepID=A0A9D4M2F3_DREPO|nr:hypothetical protein DPMN_031108 [Dreissena polymorpha]KAH3875814.1 hypothetical protein DPMN_039091 [Dreissena polymorpha]
MARAPPGLVMVLCIVEIERIVIREVRYQLDVNRCRNEDIIVKGNFGWAWPMWAGAPGLVMGPCIVEINHNVIREVQYQFEVNRCRNEEIIVKGNFGWAWSMWAWPMWAGHPRVGNGAMYKLQYQFEDIRCSSSAYSVGGESGQDGQKTEITTISPLFLRKALGY